LGMMVRLALSAPARLILWVSVAASMVAGCAVFSEPFGQAAARGRAARERATADDLLRRQTTVNQELELKLNRAYLVLLEREAQLRALQEKLDLATLEVVRSMARLRGVESKAEAASNFAEAEIALQLLEKAAGRGRDQDVQQAKQLMRMATEEFKRQNYAGTMYLTGRVKALSAGGEWRASRDARLDGEAGFPLPLPLKALSKSNVREGPGLNHKVAFVVEDGAPLTGHSHIDVWVRVSRNDGRSGWMFYNLVGLR